MRSNVHLLSTSHLVLLIMKNVSDKRFRESQNTHFVFSNFLKKKRPLRDNVEKYCRAGQATDGNTIQCMCIACWIPKATGSHLEYDILTAFPLQHELHESNSMFHYMRCYPKVPKIPLP